MTMNKKTLKTVILLVGVISIYFIDLHDRLSDSDEGFYEMTFVENEYRLGDYNNDPDYPKELYKRNFENEKYKFPRTEVDKIIVYRNLPIVSRLTRKIVTEQQRTELEIFFNTPENFDWNETTWTLSESDYIVRFFNAQNIEIGKVWICLNRCGMTFSSPFSPNMKFGSLSNFGLEKIESILKS